MTIQPDITRESQPWYRVENRHRGICVWSPFNMFTMKCIELYEYSLEHVSIDVSSDDKLIHQNLSDEVSFIL